MPRVGRREFPYTKKGKRNAQRYARKTGQPVGNSGGTRGAGPARNIPPSRRRPGQLPKRGADVFGQPGYGPGGQGQRPPSINERTVRPRRPVGPMPPPNDPGIRGAGGQGQGPGPFPQPDPRKKYGHGTRGGGTGPSMTNRGGGRRRPGSGGPRDIGARPRSVTPGRRMAPKSTLRRVNNSLNSIKRGRY